MAIKGVNRAPNFFLLGAAKAGTTSLYAMLKQHPQIFMSSSKETQFFFNDGKFRKGFQFYLDTYFWKAGGYPFRGEASPSYFHAPALVAPRMKSASFSERLKFIVVLRDPVERAWSHYLHRRRVCAETCSFPEALELEHVRLKRKPTSWVGYFSDGLYGQLTSEWFEYFPKDAFLFLDYEEATKDWTSSLKSICLHLGADPTFKWRQFVSYNTGGVPRNGLLMQLLQRPRPSLRRFKSLIGQDNISNLRRILNRINTRPEPSPVLDPSIEMELRKRYTSDIEQLERILGRNYEKWKLNSN